MAADRSRLLVSGHGRYFQLGGLAGRIICTVESTPKTAEELQRELSGDEEFASSPDDRIQECIQKLVGHGILNDGSGAPVKELAKKSKWFGHRYFTVRFPLLPPKFVSPLTKRLAALYSPFWIAVLCPALVFVHLAIWLYVYFHNHTSLALEWPSGAAMVAIVVGNYAGLLMHELGHASACVRCNIQHGPIGVGVYLVFPAFYTDVSEAWKLSRTQRMAVDAAGIYTSLVLSTFSFFLFAVTLNSVFLVLTMLYDLTVLMNLNPFIRMDCYWLLSDALDVSNLMARTKEMTGWLVRRLCGLPAPWPALLKTEPKLRATLLAYYAGSIIFGAALIGRLCAVYMPHYLAALPGSVVSLKLTMKLYGASPETAAKAFKILMSSVPLLGMVLYAARSLSRVFHHINGTSQ